MKRKISFYGNYFSDFYSKQDLRIKEKIDFVLDLISNVDRVPVKFFKSLEGTDGIFEIRVITVLKNIRIFCFFDEGNLIIITNCFVKKTEKTPKKELELAIKLKKEYCSERMRG